MPELKPYECGGVPQLLNGSFPLDIKYYVFCDKCRKTAAGLYNCEEEAIAAWNKRVKGERVNGKSRI